MKKTTLLGIILLLGYLGQAQPGATILGPNVPTTDFVSFNTNTPFSLFRFGESLSANIGRELAGDIDPTNTDIAYVLSNTNSFFELDLITTTYTFLEFIISDPDSQWVGLEFDPSTNILYGLDSANDGLSGTSSAGSSRLYTIDIATNSRTLIGELGLTAISIATDGNGNFYTHDLATDSIYTIDITTAETTLVGPTGFDAEFPQDMEWDAASGRLYMTSFNNENFEAELREVDITTGNAEFIDNIDSGSSFTQIAWASIRNESTAPLSVNENKTSQISLYPNPTQGILSINSAIPMERVTIYNSLGQNVATYTTNNLQQYSINTDGISKGLYVVELTTSSGTLTEKFIKQ